MVFTQRILLTKNTDIALIAQTVAACNTWVKVSRIIPEFRISRLTFLSESQPQNAELGRL